MIVTARTGSEQGGKRLDDAARELFPQLSKGRIRKIIDWGGCAVSGTMVRVASRTVREGEEIILGVMEPEHYLERCLFPEEILLNDADYLAVNKESGMNCQRTPYQLKGTLEHAVSLFFREEGSSEPARVIHRLDRGTSGVMIFPKDRPAAAHISRLLQNGEVEKVYWCLSEETPEREEWRADLIMAKIAKSRYGVATPGKDSSTLFRVLARGEGLTLIEARPLTGRTHQIRVHLEHYGCPIAGDTTYGGMEAPRLMLHCRSMCFSGGEGLTRRIVAPVDAAFRELCRERGIALPEED